MCTDKQAAVREIFQDVADNILNNEARKWLEQGGLAIGYTCATIPREIITAAGFLPLQLRAGSRTEMQSDPCVGPACWNFAHDGWRIVLEGDYEFLSGIIFSNSCGITSRLSKKTEAYLRDKFTCVSSIAVPMNNGNDTVEWLSNELFILKAKIEKDFGGKITDEQLWKAIGLHNQRRKLQKRLNNLRKLDNPPLSGLETLHAIIGGTAMPVTRYNKLLSELLSQIGRAKRVGDKRPRLMLEGMIPYNPAYIKAIEAQGVMVVAEMGCIGTRDGRKDAYEGPNDPILALARIVASQRMLCPHDDRYDRQRADNLVAMIKDFKVDGVISMRFPNCDKAGKKADASVRELDAVGIPYLRLEEKNLLNGFGLLNKQVKNFLHHLKKDKGI